MYIDERKTRDGWWKLESGYVKKDWNELTEAEKRELKKLDWNDLNPWVEANDRSQDDSKVPGGQIEIKPWTMFKWPGAPFYSAGGEVYNSIAYTYGCADSPKDFNEDLENQRIANNASSTLAPETDLDDVPVPSPNDNYWYNYNKNSYLPHYSYIKAIDANYFNGYPNLTHPYYSGLDCAGLVDRSSCYDKTKYKLGKKINDNDDRYVIDDVGWGHPGYTRREDYNIYIWKFGSIKEGMYRIIPGDIYNYNGHVVIIQRIIYIKGRNTTSGNILFIESTVGNNLFCVQNTRTQEKHEEWSKTKNPHYGRLKVE